MLNGHIITVTRHEIGILVHLSASRCFQINKEKALLEGSFPRHCATSRRFVDSTTSLAQCNVLMWTVEIYSLTLYQFCENIQQYISTLHIGQNGQAFTQPLRFM